MAVIANPHLERRLAREQSGEVLFDAFSRGRYATDASIYQMMPLGVVVPKTAQDVEAAIAIAREEGVPVLPRGGGTSQCGQTVNAALVIDTSKYLNRIVEYDPGARRAIVEPGIVLDDLNRQLNPDKLWFPVDVSTASRATLGGMAGNNSCGGRSLRFGTTRDNVIAIDAILADGTKARFSETEAPEALRNSMLDLGRREAPEINSRFPKVQRRVGGYNIDALVPRNRPANMAHLLVGSEGTLGFSTAIELNLWPTIGPRVMGICHFATFYEAMDAAQHIVTLKPIAVELVDSTMIALARDIDMFRPTIEEVVRGEPAALLLVEFAEETEAGNQQKLRDLEQLMSDLGFTWQGAGKSWGGVVPVTDDRLQTAVTEVRKSGLNIMMSMKQDGKPVSFVEDCAVELPHLADYTTGLTDIFTRHGTRGTWYAHASVGCLHVRPVLNLKQDLDVKKMRAIAEEAFELVRRYKGSHSGEHGDGIVRSEFHEAMFGPRMVRAFEVVKRSFDPTGLFNPGKIVSPPKMDDRSLFRYQPEYSVPEFNTELDWSDWLGAGGGFQGAVEMCNNNGACRKLAGGAMCPSYRVTRNERDVTRGRANALRLAIAGQLGPDALTGVDMAETLKLCVSCKACRLECPTGVDMARMKLEVSAARAARHGLPLRDRLIAGLPQQAMIASRVPWLFNARNTIPGLASLLESPTGLTAKRKLPAWRSDAFRDNELSADEPQALLFADTFNRYFEPHNLRAAATVIEATGVTVAAATSAEARPLCCGRTWLTYGRVDRARAEARRLLAAVMPLVRNGIPVFGIEPSCLLTLKDEYPGLLPGDDTRLLAQNVMLFEEFVLTYADVLKPKLAPRPAEILIHGHCHQKSFGLVSDVENALRLLPGASVSTIESGCCGMAGAFGYGADTYDVSMQMAELDLLPAVRAATPDTIIVADGTSCRHQISDGAGRQAMHVANVLADALATEQ